MTAQATLHADQPGATISRHIYGQFAEHLGHCIYEGIWVGENSSIPNTRGIRNDVVAALKNLQVPVLRWPGGCFADEYHWRDGIGPREKRPAMINTHWGGVVENNNFGTHEFFDLCEQVGCEPYVCANVGSGTPQEAMEWVEYMTSDADSPMANLRRKNGREKPWKLPFLAVGNESWGCGGNMRPEYYADNYRRYNTFVKNYAGQKVYRVAGGPNSDDYHWTDVVMSIAGKYMDGLSMHMYTIPAGHWTTPKGSATQFSENEYVMTLKGAYMMDELVTKHSAIMDKYDPEKKVGLVVDEWGVWTDVEPGTNPGFLYQQNSMRDALLAALHFGVFHKHADRVSMANIAQMVNVLQAMILTDKEKMLLTPTYHVFEMYKGFQDSQFLPIEVTSPEYSVGDKKIPAVTATAAISKAKHVVVSFVNVDPRNSATVSCKLAGKVGTTVKARILTAEAMNSCNTFDKPNTVVPKAFDAFKRSGDQLQVTLPSKSVVVLDIE
ncbi:alpha-N-arabinofuranosidase [Opitutaceae bacterium EW11]|nr:alpha-N-arabinofuranosidase [Opitutaceae bacterium EW11]